ncbi:M43 family zinc metalloprotease [Chryseobacterium polytrichastri]|uniref:Por secretion system C-terminal sorting domain-containing protein n=1 Tax=Chryseobacterium polytrichastri TaxID=1302687 RepID=A0A1M7FAQ0_9FLAO|nr:M43 family zinc metalloprotease [Chryseobacterium polytrichastri]SHM01090.1 Por secretion system C-terminal sorting domain-containing protein [Chryseobacterium polytrichastri]
MRKSTTSKSLFLLPLFCAGLMVAQNTKGTRKKIESIEKTPQELVQSNGFERCGTTEYEEFLRKNFPGRLSVDQFEAWLKPLIQKAKNEKSQNGGIITIPVVVHVIHGGQAYGSAPNIIDEQVMSQIIVMNQDYRKLMGTPGFNNSAVGADVQLQFALAKVDPNGNPTNGIDRVNLCQSTFKKDVIEAFVKPETIWNPNQYMNMWSVAFASPNTNLLGYAQFPDGSNLPGLDPLGGYDTTDGVVASYNAFGSNDFGNNFILNSTYNKGRTMTHEVGHFLGLRHIWGDSACGDDFCADTPTAHTANYTCIDIASCNDPSVLEMVQNYMDYTNDACMNIFTINQKDRITAVMNNSARRASLKTSTKDVAIPLFANDAEIKLERTCATVTCEAVQSIPVSLFNRGTNVLTSAKINYTINGVAQSPYNWTGTLPQDKLQLLSLPVAAGTIGGPMTISIETANGVADQRASNNTVTSTYVGAPMPVTNNVIFNLQLDYYGSETSWTLKNSAGATVYSGNNYPDVLDPNTMPIPALITQNWTLNPDDCYTFTISDSYGDGFAFYGGYFNIKTPAGITLISGGSFTTSQRKVMKVSNALSTSEVNKKDHFGIYPNPVSDILNITNVSNKATFQIHNAVGQVVKGGNIDNNQVRVSDFVKGTYIITIKDNTISESIKFIKN